MVDLYGFDFFPYEYQDFYYKSTANIEQLSKRVNYLKISIFLVKMRLFIDLQCVRYVFVRMCNLLIKHKNIKIHVYLWRFK